MYQVTTELCYFTKVLLFSRLHSVSKMTVNIIIPEEMSTLKTFHEGQIITYLINYL